MPHYRLTGHYRSRHESLICFSNHAYYGGELVTYLHSYAVGDRDVEVVRADLLDAIARKPPRTMTADIAGITAHELVRRLRRP
jgi:hypothetical protein